MARDYTAAMGEEWSDLPKRQRRARIQAMRYALGPKIHAPLSSVQRAALDIAHGADQYRAARCGAAARAEMKKIRARTLTSLQKRGYLSEQTSGYRLTLAGHRARMAE